MASSYSNILIHLVFSTKHREPLIGDAWRHELHACMATIARNAECPLLAVNSMPDHVHLLLPLSRSVTMADLVRDVKVASSKWIGESGLTSTPFAWQTGYGAFSVSASHRVAVMEYIANQAEHHRRQSFQDEFVALLRRYEIDFEEKYVFG